ncbi:spherulation-specific family 4 protein [Luteococcus sp. Sow4_B9]|uniref:spherulation-specific family 4 protein n=1 Tax=Luteococcus sp. Sow4_B9 TaxID=3438792 RepID=UPI003F9BB0B6
MHLASPWYIHPAVAPDAWTDLRAGRLPLAWAVVNVNSGPGGPDDPYYAQALAPGCATTLVGYVTVGYGRRSTHEVLAEARLWRELYGITDVMLDEVPYQAAQDNWSMDTIAALRRDGVDRVFTNPGCVPVVDLLHASDAVCVAEQTWQTYRSLDWPQWLVDGFPGRTWHLVHSTPASEREAALALAAQREAGFVWVTDAELPNPWGALPAGLGTGTVDA